jgi:hypothetical protein
MHAEFYIYFDHYVSPKYYGGNQINGHGTLAEYFCINLVSERFSARDGVADAGGFGEKFVVT